MKRRSVWWLSLGWLESSWKSILLCALGLALVLAVDSTTFAAETPPPEPSYEPRYPWDTPLQGLATIGVALAEKRDVEQYPFAVRGDKLELNPGFAATLGTGGQLQRWLRLELETGVIGNELH